MSLTNVKNNTDDIFLVSTLQDFVQDLIDIDTVSNNIDLFALIINWNMDNTEKHWHFIMCSSDGEGKLLIGGHYPLEHISNKELLDTLNYLKDNNINVIIDTTNDFDSISSVYDIVDYFTE